jgi:Tol biopolymer transport system component
MGFLALIGLLLFAGCSLGDSRSDSEDIVFSRVIDGSVDLFKIESGTSEPVRLSASGLEVVSPAWSPDKEQIAFLARSEGNLSLWITDKDGKSMRQVTEPSVDVADFRWSPDSVRIALETYDVDSGGPDPHSISILDTVTEEMVSLTSSTEDVRVGDWSPDGEWVVYSVNEGADSAIRRRNPTGVDEITLFTGRAINPRWSRNGQWIAFNRVNEDGSVDLALMDKDGGNESLVVAGVNGSSPHVWSPDSKRLVYVSGEFDDSEIFVVGRDGKDGEQLTSNRVADAGPRWSPDGSSILFMSEGDGTFDIYSMDKNGEGQMRLTTGDDLVVDADW